MSDALAPLRSSSVVMLTSYRRDGRGVGTMVGIRVDGDRAYVTTRSKTWKVKRIARNPKVTVAPCTRRGKVTGPAVECLARVVDTNPRESFGMRFWVWVYRVFYRDVPVTYELTPVETAAS
ncbi:PPOX class F420-dependent oxidoreductase [Thermasporomyces composti]|jgi:hypothetical protein|uniref:PPOX class probable F420-dependent enzyme n=1 Tax=Thermasporomyces composti TaxID=696763 RepID=A0A3D9V3J8_THECX|nr:PPOX class F420-dependent oxidoreductase [Thermasporomyces composti]REF36298.1 PPOX class probable F420-dependent enzyme [Thermasporomyces composti]